MLSLDQVRLLENRVQKAVGKITSLTDENARLRSQLTGLQTRVNELEGLVRSFKDDQGRIEEGILSALDRLSAFEDSVFHGESAEGRVIDTAVEANAVPFAAEGQPPAAQPVGTDTILDDNSLSPADDLSPEPESNPQIEIEAEWQNTPAKPSSDGQMDIF